MLSSTLRNYTKPVYKQTSWERLSNDNSSAGFQLLDIEILESGAYAEDQMFESFDSKKERKNPYKKEEEKVEVDPAIEQAKIKAQLEERYNQGKAEGLEQGKQEEQARHQQQIQEIKDQLAALTTGVAQQMAAFYAQVEKESAKLALQISRKILATTAQVKPDYIIEVIRLALQSLGAAKPLSIRVSRDDYEFIKVIGLPVELTAEELGIEYLADDMVKSGCIVNTDFGEVDLQLDVMWEQVAEQLAEVYR
ncbi:MAG: hypothetical protein IT292_09550 [Deltaproteobacteria bacterium]|nr:hypothetical protein [Deltaproteobacteria bacterium]